MILFDAYEIYPDLQFLPKQECNHTDSTRWQQLQKSRWLQLCFIEIVQEVVYRGSPSSPKSHRGKPWVRRHVCLGQEP